jgi:hypothetical protein
MSKREDPRIARTDHEWLHRAKAQGFDSEGEMYRQLYHDKRMDCAEIGELLGGFCATHISHRMKRCGVQRRHGGGSRGEARAAVARKVAEDRWNGYAKTLGYKNQREMLRDLYKSRSLRSIADLLGMTTSAVAYHMEQLGIRRRPKGGANFHGITEEATC